jgi:hypothetical protein
LRLDFKPALKARLQALCAGLLGALRIWPPPLLSKPPEFGNPPVVLIVHCVVCTLAVKLPLLCARAVEDPNNASAMIAMLQNATFVMI